MSPGIARLAHRERERDGSDNRDDGRTLALPRQLVDSLRTHRARQIEERLRAGSAWQGEGLDLVFCREDGAPIYGPNVTRSFQRALDQAGLPRQRFHDLRHGAASFMLAQGVPLKVAQEVLGHSTIAVTADIYTHLTPEATRDATQRVGELLWGS